MPRDQAQFYRIVACGIVVLCGLTKTVARCDEPVLNRDLERFEGRNIVNEDLVNAPGARNRWLPGDDLTGTSGLSLEGWLQQGLTWNPDRPPDRFNGPVSQNDRANEYQLNQLYLIAGCPADTDSDAMSCGFQSDLIFGTDAFYFQALGIDDRVISDDDSRFYKLAIPQLYAELYTPIGPGILFRAGKWFALVGYETGLGTEDFFYSHTIGFNPTPYSHTGVLASFDLSDQLTTSHGVHRGSDTWEDNNSALGYTGLVRWTSSSEASNLTFAINLGPEQDQRADWQDLDGSPGPDAPGQNLNRILYSLTFETELTDSLLYVVNHDYFFQHGSATYGIPNTEAYGVAQYLIYEHSDRVTSGLRFEIYRDDDGIIEGFRSQSAAAACVYTNLTLGMQLRPCECIMVRPEIRWDWQDPDDPVDTPAFSAGSSNDQFLFSIDAIMTF